MRKIVRLAMAPIVCSLAAGYVVLGITDRIAPPEAVAQVVQIPPGVEAEPVRYSSAGLMIEAYLARPKSASKSPAVLVVHDDLGLNKRFRELTHQLAQAGFIALAPDLLSRRPTAGAESWEGSPERTPVAGLDWNQTVEDVKAAFAFLQQDSGVDPARISAIGVGWGEFRVWKLAEQAPSLHRAVVYYGITPTDDDRLRNVRAAVSGHYAEHDYLVTASVLNTKRLLGERFTYYIYPTHRGFLGGSSGSGPLQSAAAAAKQAWARTLDFLRKGSR